MKFLLFFFKGDLLNFNYVDCGCVCGVYRFYWVVDDVFDINCNIMFCGENMEEFFSLGLVCVLNVVYFV